jgi:hypothetical protein
MRQGAWVLAVAAAAILAPGCQKTMTVGPMGAPVVKDGPRLKIDWPTPPQSPSLLTPPAAEGPMILVQARFIAAEPARMKAAGLITDKPFEILGAEDWTSRLQRLESGHLTAIVSAPRVTVMSGQEACVMVCSETPVEIDCRHKMPESEAVKENEKGKAKEKDKAKERNKETYLPVIEMVPQGVALEVKARAEGGDAVFTEIKPRQSTLIGMRSCSATVPLTKGDMRAKWQEPLVLVGAGRVSSPCQIRVRPGQCVMVPMVYCVHGTSASVRALAKDGKVQEELTGAEWKRGTPTFGKRPCVMVLSAEIVRSKPAAAL